MTGLFTEIGGKILLFMMSSRWFEIFKRRTWKRRWENIYNRLIWDFPGGPVVKNPPSNAGDVGSIPGWGTKIPHAAGQLSPRATTGEPRATTKDPVCHN